MSSCRRISAINRRCRPDLSVCTFCIGLLYLHAPNGFPWGKLARRQPRLMRAGEHLPYSFAVSAKHNCSPTLIRPCGAPSPRGRHGDFRISKASPMRGSCRREATDEVDNVANPGAPTSPVTASPCRLPLVGEGFWLQPAYPTGYVTPSTVMEARSARSMIWENSQVSFTSLSLPAQEESHEP